MRYKFGLTLSECKISIWFVSFENWKICRCFLCVGVSPIERRVIYAVIGMYVNVNGSTTDCLILKLKPNIKRCHHKSFITKAWPPATACLENRKPIDGNAIDSLKWVHTVTVKLTVGNCVEFIFATNHRFFFFSFCRRCCSCCCCCCYCLHSDTLSNRIHSKWIHESLSVWISFNWILSHDAKLKSIARKWAD